MTYTAYTLKAKACRRLPLCALIAASAGCGDNGTNNSSPDFTVVCNTQGVFSVNEEARFWSCNASVPPARNAQYPTQSWNGIAAKLASCMTGGTGVDIQYKFDLPNAKAGITLQRIVQSGEFQTSSNGVCAANSTAVNLDIVERFDVPAYDLQVAYTCCSAILQQDTQSSIAFVASGDLRADVAAALPAIAQGERAVLVTPAVNYGQNIYLQQTIANCPAITWVQRYETDHCNQTPTTTCGSPGCFNLTATDVNGTVTKGYQQ